MLKVLGSLWVQLSTMLESSNYPVLLHCINTSVCIESIAPFPATSTATTLSLALTISPIGACNSLEQSPCPKSLQAQVSCCSAAISSFYGTHPISPNLRLHPLHSIFYCRALSSFLFLEIRLVIKLDLPQNLKIKTDKRRAKKVEVKNHFNFQPSSSSASHPYIIWRFSKNVRTPRSTILYPITYKKTSNTEFPSLGSHRAFPVLSHHVYGSNDSEEHAAADQLIQFPTVLDLHMLSPLHRRYYQCTFFFFSFKVISRTSTYPLCQDFTTC